jgi:hypothetical protein
VGVAVPVGLGQDPVNEAPCVFFVGFACWEHECCVVGAVVKSGWIDGSLTHEENVQFQDVWFHVG